ncbi:MAG: hypothetical protein ABJA83_11250 [Burkholderiaceae bacterium]
MTETRRKNTGIASELLDELVPQLRRILATHVPDWTEHNESDPGVTLVEAFAFLTENLMLRNAAVHDRWSAALRRAAASLARLSAHTEQHSTPLRRPNYFTGQLLDAQTLRLEQDYHREKLRRLTRAAVGYGVVSGLEVGVESSAEGAAQVTVAAGAAIDRRGELLTLPCSESLALPPGVSIAFVTIEFHQQLTTPAPAPNEATVMTVVEESCSIRVRQHPDLEALVLARAVREGGLWSLDPEWAVKRLSDCNPAS